MKFNPLIENESAKQGFTHRLDFSYKDIPAGIGLNTPWAPNIAGLPAGTIGWDLFFILVTPFANTADAAHNTTTISIGDGGSVGRYLLAVQANQNGAFVNNSKGASPVNNLYTSADNLKLELGSMAAKSVSNLNRGQAIVLLRITNENRPDIIDNQQP